MDLRGLLLMVISGKGEKGEREGKKREGKGRGKGKGRRIVLANKNLRLHPCSCAFIL